MANTSSTTSSSSSSSSTASSSFPSTTPNLPSWFNRLTWDDNFDIIFSLAYYGTRYNGYQRQMGSRHHHHVTVEDTLHTVFEQLLKDRFPFYTDMIHYPLFSSMSINSASRLDAGVHCRDLILRASLPVYTVLPVPHVPIQRNNHHPSDSGSSLSTSTTPSNLSIRPSSLPSTLDTPSRMMDELHRLLPPDIRITKLRYCRPSQIWLPKLCGGKTYSYYIGTGYYPWTVQHCKYLIYTADELDVSLMATALQDFIGIHDFRFFSSLPRDYKHPNYEHEPPRLNPSKFDDENTTSTDTKSSTTGRKRDNSTMDTNDDDDDDEEEEENDSDEETVEPSSVPKPPNDTSISTARKREKLQYVKTTVREIKSVKITLLSPEECDFSISRSDLDLQPPIGIVVPPLSSIESSTEERTVLPGKERTMEIYQLSRPTKASVSVTGTEPTLRSSSASFPPRCILRFDIAGKGFLKHQIRHIIGTVLEIGKKRLNPTFIRTTLQSIRDYNTFIHQPGYLDKYRNKDPVLLKELSTYIDRLPSMEYAAYQVSGRGLWLQRTFIPSTFWENDYYTNNVYRNYCLEWDIPLDHYYGVGFVRGHDTAQTKRTEEKQLKRQRLMLLTVDTTEKKEEKEKEGNL